LGGGPTPSRVSRPRALMRISPACLERAMVAAGLVINPQSRPGRGSDVETDARRSPPRRAKRCCAFFGRVLNTSPSL